MFCSFTSSFVDYIGPVRDNASALVCAGTSVANELFFGSESALSWLAVQQLFLMSTKILSK